MLDRVADMLGCICSHKFSFGFGGTFCDIAMTYTLNQVLGYGGIWLAWRYRLGMGVYATWAWVWK
jgi:hypothetical protein